MIKNLCTIVFLFLGSCVFAQQFECKVNLPEISGSYTGECKKGLAHGKGIAQGVDRYEGQFFKGLPNGKGKYTWANGSYYDGEWKSGMREGQGKLVSGDTVINGFWRANNYQGKKPQPSYMITSTRNVGRSTFTRSVEKDNGVKIRLLLGGSDNKEIEDFSLAYNTGSEYRNFPVYGIENASFPLNVIVRYRTWNQLHTIQYDVLFEFAVLAPGTWLVTLYTY
jgi:hypothetical protein